MNSIRNLCFLGILLFSSSLIAQNFDKIDSDILDQFDTKDEVKVMIHIKSNQSLQPKMDWSKERKTIFVYQNLIQSAEQSQKEIIRILDQNQIDYQSFYLVNAIAAKLDLNTLYTLSEHGDVQHIYWDRPAMVDYIIDEEEVLRSRMTEPEWGIKMIQADSVWSLGYTGENVVIAGQDTGYDFEHPTLLKKYRGYSEDANHEHDYNWHDAIREINPLHGDTLITETTNPCGLNVDHPCDDNNHGTHTMGTMIGSDDENSIGVAPDAKWIACRNMERGYGSPSTYIECFEWFLAPTKLDGTDADPTMAPHVIANSWGCPEMEGCNASNWHLMDEAVENLRSAGVVVVVSAGNSGSSCESVRNPAAIFQGSFSVGATASNDTIAGFSSRGPVAVDSSFRLKPDISAPGVGVRSTIRNGGFASFSGTSMAGPHVAGVVGLIISANPALAGQVEIIEEIIRSTAVPKTTDQDCGDYLGSEIPNAVYGYGRIDALAAVEQALNVSNTKDISSSWSTTIFPNPTADFLQIQSERLISKIVIVDALGQVMYRKQYDYPLMEFNITDVERWAHGLYHIQLWNGNQVQTQSIIK